MKRLFVGLLLSGFFLFSCSKSPNNPVDRSDPGSANITVEVGKVGVLGKIRNIELSKLYISLTAPGEIPIYDTINLSGNGQQTISKTYSDLASLLKTWTLLAESRDVDGVVIHSGSTQFIVPARNTISVALNLDAKYSMLKANFFPIRDSVTRCELLVDGSKVDDSSFAKQALLGDTVRLSNNYLTTGISQRVKLDVYGIMWGFDTLLYTGDTAITPLPGINASYTITLRWVGPGPLPGGASMTVVLGAIGTVVINGIIPIDSLITIDARQLTTNFYIPNITGYLSKDTIRTFHLAPGNYAICTPGSNISFQITSTGTVAYDPTSEGILSGSGTKNLIVHGSTITVDARELTSIFYIRDIMGYMSKDTIRTLHLLPGNYAVCTPGSGISFQIATNGTVAYDPASEGILSGNGTNSLVVHGSTITVDARQLASPEFLIRDITWFLSKDSIRTFNLLPGNYHLTSSTVSFDFAIIIPGIVQIADSLFAKVGGNGTNQITILPQSPLTVTDIDGNVYSTVIIGTQVWMEENLRVTKYNDGSLISLDTSTTTWNNATTPKYCFYNNTTDSVSIKKYGALYNWYVVDPSNPKKIAPTGWHVPSDAEWDTLKNYLIAKGYNWDGTIIGNKIAKSLAANTDWYTDINAGYIGCDLTKNNSSGFSTLPSGSRYGVGMFYGQSHLCNWWSATECAAFNAYGRGLYDFDIYLAEGPSNKSSGLSVRLLRD